MAEKRLVYARYLRAISASWARAIVGQRDRSEDGNLHAATAEIELLGDPRVAAAARELRDSVIDAHSRKPNAQLTKATSCPLSMSSGLRWLRSSR